MSGRTFRAVQYGRPIAARAVERAHVARRWLLGASTAEVIADMGQAFSSSIRAAMLPAPGWRPPAPYRSAWEAAGHEVVLVDGLDGVPVARMCLGCDWSRPL